jgi:ELWxxDGT repeat protein
VLDGCVPEPSAVTEGLRLDDFASTAVGPRMALAVVRLTPGSTHGEVSTVVRRALAAVLSLVALVGGSPAQAVSVPGPAVVRDINLGPQARFGTSAVADGKVFFTNVDSTRHELWRTDGTPSGTVRLARFRPGINELTDGGGQLLFSADDGSHGRDLWRSDGTAAGTMIVADLVPGGGGSNPANLAAVGADVFFSVTAPTAGLWRSDGGRRWFRRTRTRCCTSRTTRGCCSSGHRVPPGTRFGAATAVPRAPAHRPTRPPLLLRLGDTSERERRASRLR